MQRYSRIRPESQYQPPPPNSSTSSADGYESFENTNNKKKRKIPLSGGLGVAPDVVGAGVPTQAVNVPYSESVRANSTALGMSGPGRDRGRRIVRSPNERRPLANTSNNIVPYTNGKTNDAEVICTLVLERRRSSQILTNNRTSTRGRPHRHCNGQYTRPKWICTFTRTGERKSTGTSEAGQGRITELHL